MHLLRSFGADGKRTEKNKTVLEDENGKQAEDVKKEEDGNKDQDEEQGGSRTAGNEKVLMNLTYPLTSSRPFRRFLKEKEQQKTGSSSHSVSED